MSKEHLKTDPSVQRLANMPDEIYQLFQTADPVRAAIIAECKEIVYGNGKTA